jgi:site-specific recombinase XerD
MDYRAEAPDIVRRFLTYIEAIKGKSAKTAREYYLDLRLFLRYMKKLRGLEPWDKPFEEVSIADVDEAFVAKITLNDIYDFLNFLTRERPTQPNSKNTGYGLGAAARARKVAAIRAFFKYLTSKAMVLKENPAAELDSPTIKKGLPRYLSLDESRTLLDSVDGENEVRDYCILTLFLNCGMRVSELAGINLQDIKDDTLRVTGKGNKERTVYLNDACLAALDAWLQERKKIAPQGENALFVSRLRKRISVPTVKWLVKKRIQEAGLDASKYSAHKLRHTAATLMYKNGVDVLALQEILGHEQLNTTKIYTHVENADLRRAVNANPLSGMVRKKDKDRKEKE